MIRIGMVFKGFCGGAFGRMYTKKRVESFGVDWIVVRDEDGEPGFCWFPHDENLDDRVATWLLEPEFE